MCAVHPRRLAPLVGTFWAQLDVGHRTAAGDYAARLKTV
jgi:hypothetical protein